MPRTTTQEQTTGEAMETIAVVIPTLNEECSIGKVIDNVPVADLLQNGLKTTVYVIDGQSTDNTREIAVEKGPTLMQQGWAVINRQQKRIHSSERLDDQGSHPQAAY